MHLIFIVVKKRHQTKLKGTNAGAHVECFQVSSVCRGLCKYARRPDKGVQEKPDQSNWRLELKA